MMKLTQQYYDLCMNYVGLNQRCAALFAPTPYTGILRWHERNHEVYDGFNRHLTKYIGNLYGEYAIPKVVETYGYKMPSSMLAHVDGWAAYLKPLKDVTAEMYSEARDVAHDFELAGMMIDMNKCVCNEILALSRLRRRINGLPESELLLVNKEVHDYFQGHHDCKCIDLSL